MMIFPKVGHGEIPWLGARLFTTHIPTDIRPLGVYSSLIESSTGWQPETLIPSVAVALDSV
jgi:hypothetical protein